MTGDQVTEHIQEKIMRKPFAITVFAPLVLGLSTAAGADTRPYGSGPVEFADRAPVLSSTPVYEEYNAPRRECWTEQVSYRQPPRAERSYGGAILGGVVGGLLGHQVGGGTGKSVATAVGAATGAIVGDNIDNDGHRASGSRTVTEERCRYVDNWTRRISGYNVVYRYQGHEYTTFLPYDPGQELRLRVNVSVVERW